MSKQIYIVDNTVAFELMNLLKAKARHFIRLDEHACRLFDGQSVVTLTTLGNDIQVEIEIKELQR